MLEKKSPYYEIYKSVNSIFLTLWCISKKAQLPSKNECLFLSKTMSMVHEEQKQIYLQMYKGKIRLEIVDFK